MLVLRTFPLNAAYIPPAADRQMARVLDLRKMATVANFIPSDERANAQKHAIKTLVAWLASRFNGTASTDNMPDHEAVYDQFVLLTKRLQIAYGEAAFSSKWTGASGTVIMYSPQIEHVGSALIVTD